MKLHFLGTGSIPTKDRSPQGICLQVDEDYGILIDCGEGIQMQLVKSELKPSSVYTVLLTHRHMDHVYGICGWISHIGKHVRTIKIGGPEHVLAHIQKLITVIKPPMYQSEIEYFNLDKLSDISESVKITSFKTDHTDHSVAYVLEKDGVKVAFTGDMDRYDEHVIDKLREVDHMVLDGVHIPLQASCDLVKQTGIQTTYLLPVRNDMTLKEIQEAFNHPVIIPGDLDVYRL